MNQIQHSEEEISLREIIEVIWNGKWLIALITIFAVVTSGIVNSFALAPVYEANSTLMVNQPQIRESTSENSVGALLDSLSQYPQIPMETYTDQIRNPYIIQNVIEKLNLDPNVYSVNGLRGAITVQAVENTNLIEIKFSGEDPALTAKIVNTLSQEFVSFITAKTKEQLSKSADYLKEQLEIEQEQVDQSVENLKTFLAQPKSPNELENEIDSRIKQLTDFKINIGELQIRVNALQSSIKQARSQLHNTPKTLITKKSLADDDLMRSIQQERTGQSISESAQISIESEEINPVYIYLQSQIASMSIEVAQLTAESLSVKDSIQVNQKAIEELQTQYAEKQAELDRLQLGVDNSRESYKQFAQSYEEARITSSIQVGSVNITMLAPALDPTSPVGPNKLLNTVITAVISLMLSILIVFFRYYWKVSAGKSYNSRHNGISV